ncbi:MAG: hypothetical protein B6I38_02495 [Anaerolineaceae bacterium 4572_5.1]|nr:MAG: hypothetical protein B6I38_02495 [Anaerolineaceae bacterium 4572_5.1]
MKKILLAVLLTIMAGCLVSCGGKPTENDIQVAMTYIAKTQTLAPATLTPMLEQTSFPEPSATITPVFTSAPVSSTDTVSGNRDINWKDVGFYYGEIATVCGPVVGTHFASSSNGQPTFLNIGKDFPAEDRFVVVIWADNRDNFPDDLEHYYLGKTICVTGEVEEYQSVYQIEAKSSSDIEVE